MPALLGGLPDPQRGDGKEDRETMEREKEDQKTTCLFSGRQFKYPVGVVLSISRGGVIVWCAFCDAQGLEREGGRRFQHQMLNFEFLVSGIYR